MKRIFLFALTVFVVLASFAACSANESVMETEPTEMPTEPTVVITEPIATEPPATEPPTPTDPPEPTIPPLGDSAGSRQAGDLVSFAHSFGNSDLEKSGEENCGTRRLMR